MAPRSPSPRAGGTGAASKPRVEVPPSSTANSTLTSAGTGAQHNPIYRDTSAEYLAVRRSDLREIARFGWLEEGTGAAGMFFIAGAVWMAATLFFDHLDNPGKYWPGYLFCIACIFFGGVLIWVAHSHFSMREKRIRDYFEAPQ
jgi:hypothetical protein